MKHAIRSAEDLGRVIRAVRKSTGMRQDDLAAVVGVSQQFAVDVERGKPTVQFGRVLRLLDELGIPLTVEIPDEASRTLEALRDRPVRMPRTRRRGPDDSPEGGR
ncbi:MAG: helix-turn-helix domain-containing protein [Burkholderiales bacterium]|jgi:y4mF family transcriptional regulator